jgi:hypothetical protein
MYFVGKLEELAQRYLAKLSAGGGYTCLLCQTNLRDRFAGKSHLEAKHFPTTAGYSCHACAKTFHTRNAFYCHMSYYHKNCS